MPWTMEWRISMIPGGSFKSLAERSMDCWREMVGGLGVGVGTEFDKEGGGAPVEVARREGMVVRRSILLRVSQKPVTKLLRG